MARPKSGAVGPALYLGMLDKFLTDLGRAITEGRAIGVGDLEEDLAWLIRNRPVLDPRPRSELAAIADSLDDLDRATRAVRAAVAGIGKGSQTS